MIGIKTKVQMERTLYLDLPEDTEKDKAIEEAKKEIISPTTALYTASQALRSLHVNIPHLDLNDWVVSKTEYEII